MRGRAKPPHLPLALTAAVTAGSAALFVWAPAVQGAALVTGAAGTLGLVYALLRALDRRPRIRVEQRPREF